MWGEILYNSANIAGKIKILAKNKKIVLKQMLLDCGLGINAIGHMTSGKMPGIDTVAKIADYLEVSLDYLVGRTETKTLMTDAMSEIDMELLAAYHAKPEMQSAVNKLLGIEEKKYPRPASQLKDINIKGRLIAKGGLNIGDIDDSEDEPRHT